MSYSVAHDSTLGAILVAALDVSSALGGTNVQATGAQFVSSGVRANDRLEVVGSAAGNDGYYRIVAVVDEDNVTVDTSLSAEATNPGVLQVSARRGRWVLSVTNEDAPTWAAAAAAVPDFVQRQLLGPRDVRASGSVLSIDSGTRTITCTGNPIGNGVVGGYEVVLSGTSADGTYEMEDGTSSTIVVVGAINNQPGAAGTWEGYRYRAALVLVDLVRVEVSNSNDTVWTSEREYVALSREDQPRGVLVQRTGSGAVDVVLGRRGSDDKASRRTSAWVGFEWDATSVVSVQAFGSILHSTRQVAIGHASANEAVLGASLVDAPQVAAPNARLAIALLLTDFRGLLSSAPGISSSDNLFLLRGPLAAVVAAATFTVENLDVSSDVGFPLFTLAGLASVTLLNPKFDATVAQAFTLPIGALSAGTVAYTWDPKFVSRNVNGVVGDPIPGLVVRIWEVNEATEAESEVAGSPFTTTGDGRLNATGGVDLRRRSVVSAAPSTAVNYSHRVLVEGPGYTAVNQVITMRPSQGDVDFPVRILDPALEGGLS